MAVYKHNYQAYSGPLTSSALRFLILARYAYQRIFGSRIFLALFLICFVPPLGAAVLIYLQHNAKALQILQVSIDELIPIDAAFFQVLLYIQSSLGFILAVLVGPGLISPDLTNNALPLYLSRPLTRRDYVLGKMSALLILLSAITWLPLSCLFFFQAKMAGIAWLWEHLRLEVAIFTGAWLWMLVISLLAIALSAWVRWKPIAGALIFGVFIVGGGFGALVNEILFTRWGSLMNIGLLMDTAWRWLFRGEGTPDSQALPVWGAFAGLFCFCGVCLLLLSKKLKAYEVVRS
ncbi:MAG: ABC transporter permease subunit [Acidobacteriota bacterium]